MTVHPSRSAPRRRGRPPRIDRADIVTAAMERGLSSFSLADVAEELGVTTPALYSHVEGRDHILRLAAARVMQQLGPRLDGIDDWQQWLRAWAMGIRRQLGAVGEEVLEAVRTGVDPTSLRVAEHGLDLLTAAGLAPDEAGYALWLVIRTACTGGPAGEAGVADPVRRARAVADQRSSAGLRAAIDAVSEADAAFGFDLDIILAGLSHRLDRA